MQVDFFKLKDKDIVSYSLVKASWLQKAIRRNLVDTALSLGRVYIEEGQQRALERKLVVIAAEDVGLGSPFALLEMEKLDNVYHKIEFLCRCAKNRETDRFLLATRDNSEFLLSNKELVGEVKPFLKILTLADHWFENKRSRKFLEKLKDGFAILSSAATDPLAKDLIHLCLEKYLDLSKHKSFGARTLLALATLVATRNISYRESFSGDFTGKFIDLTYVDDFALDKHTSFGKRLNRGIEHWIEHGSVVSPLARYSSMYLSNGEEKYPYSLMKANRLKTINCNISQEPDYDVYCGRGQGELNDPLVCKIGEKGWLGNPVVKGKVCPVCSLTHAKNGDTLPCYESYLTSRLKDPLFLKEFRLLKGKKLGCFCKPAPCHTDVMIKYLEK